MRRALVLSAFLFVGVSLAPDVARAQVGGPIGAPVVFRPHPETTLIVDGRGPLRGSIEVRREGAGLTIINELDLESYVAGVREVPGLWPMEALKAQAVAARTYAMWEKERGYWQRFGFEICATVACQVYQGMAAEAGERGRRWTEAVRATSGEVLLHQDEPALTRYHSSSGGRTLPNEVVYPSAGPRPYLSGVEDPYDSVSPLHRWRVEFTREELEEILRSGISLAGTLSEVHADEESRSVTIRTLGGELEMSSVRFRRVVSEVAPRVFPARYPADREDGRRMPETIPSSRFRVERTPDGFVLNGRGYGHGVGMSQWGAMGRASDGHSYLDIIAAYYGGLRPQQWQGSQSIRAAVTRGASTARISADGPFDVVTSGGQELASSTLGGWTVAPSGERSLQVSPPVGFELPLVLTGVTAPSELVVNPPVEGATLDVDFVVPKPVQVTGVLTREAETVATAQTVVEAGEGRLAIPLDSANLARRAGYRLDVRAFDGTEEVVTTLDVVLVRPPSPLPLRIAVLTLIAVVLFVFWRWRRRRAWIPGPAGRAQSSTIPVRRHVSPGPQG